MTSSYATNLRSSIDSINSRNFKYLNATMKRKSKTSAVNLKMITNRSQLTNLYQLGRNVCLIVSVILLVLPCSVIGWVDVDRYITLPPSLGWNLSECRTYLTLSLKALCKNF